VFDFLNQLCECCMPLVRRITTLSLPARGHTKRLWWKFEFMYESAQDNAAFIDVKSSSNLRSCLEHQAPQKKHKLRAPAGWKHEFRKIPQEALQYCAT
jgi:hypothetical protein